MASCVLVALFHLTSHGAAHLGRALALRPSFIDRTGYDRSPVVSANFLEELPAERRAVSCEPSGSAAPLAVSPATRLSGVAPRRSPSLLTVQLAVVRYIH
jgi:hypothetical protein